MNRSICLALTVALLAALAMAGCGDGDSGSGAYGGRGGETTEPASTPSEGGGSGAAVVAVANNPKLGAIIVDADGLTLYDFHKDRGAKSACYGGCAQVWPPLATEGVPRAQGGASASKLGTTKRSDGTVQVTYAGHPLYTYTTDKRPGEANGNDIDSFGAEWYALTPAGTEP